MPLGSLSTVSSVWTSRRAISLHVALIVFVPGCVALTWWQVSRALGGNTLSWVYTFEWPIFAGYALYMWWKLVHDEPVPEGPLSEEPLPREPVRREPAHHGPDRTVLAAGSGEAGNSCEADEADEAGEAGEEDEEDDELAAYNRYLAELNASGRPKRW